MKKICTWCKQEQPIEDFAIRKSYLRNGVRRFYKNETRYSHCRSCVTRRTLQIYHAHPERRRKYIAHIKLSNPDHFRRIGRETAARLRILVLKHYGGRCACCGEDKTAFLAIDHIGGGGNRHRKKLKIATIFRWLKKNGFPSGYRVLCHNCNMAIGFYKHCPHEEENQSPLLVAC